MSFTQAEHLFAGVHELGLNDLFRAFFRARPRHLIYGTPVFVPATTASVTRISSLAFPGIPGGIQFAIVFSIPEVDINPDNSGGAAAIIPGPGEFTVATTATIFFLCGTQRQIHEQIGLSTPTILANNVKGGGAFAKQSF